MCNGERREERGKRIERVQKIAKVWLLDYSLVP